MNCLCIPIEHRYQFTLDLNIIVVSYRRQITIELMSGVYTGLPAGQFSRLKTITVYSFL